MLAEENRLIESNERSSNWLRWGPYLSERQWGTVREDYSENSDSWGYFTHNQSRSRAYRWGEDGLLGICDRQCRLCFAVALWNGKDPILKERLFGLTGPEGNHGEDVKECYYYLDSTPSHSYMKALYKYPQGEFPYSKLVEENRRRGRLEPEFELIDTGLFDENRYFDVFAEYAKEDPDDILIRITVENRADVAAPIHILPTLWFRNSWSWGCTHEGCERKPWINQQPNGTILTDHPSLGRFRFRLDNLENPPLQKLLFTENETNSERVFGTAKETHATKDAFHDYVIASDVTAVSRPPRGTKVAPYYQVEVPAHGKVVIRLRLTTDSVVLTEPFGPEFERIFAKRIAEADEFYANSLPPTATVEEQRVARQANAGLLWSKQFYHYAVKHASTFQSPPWAKSRLAASFQS